ncbi:hypothetical protein [Serratia fonticola]|uniref:Uncharacterized protein n=1 Tax=Serratia fonticola TaxID=47917 RepID=A0AAW3WS72_SERFO|nr:hypothetical protein [Serratia fonticola]MBC3213565.1 hypothetical protein [Serratia fonticola]NYA11469.1 hypothetical protein [Serratia fonticola]NYA31373.1 hypothetical protein [Serratia fonticola]
MKSNSYINFDVVCPVQLFNLTQPDPKVDQLLPRILGKSPNQIVDSVMRHLITLADLELIRSDLNMNRPQTNINKLTASSVGLAISEIKGE